MNAKVIVDALTKYDNIKNVLSFLSSFISRCRFFGLCSFALSSILLVAEQAPEFQLVPLKSANIAIFGDTVRSAPEARDWLADSRYFMIYFLEKGVFQTVVRRIPRRFPGSPSHSRFLEFGSTLGSA